MLNIARHVYDWFSSGIRDGLGELFAGLPPFLANPYDTVRDELVNPFRERWDDFVENTIPSAYTEMMERVRELANSIQTAGQEVFHDIAIAVQEGLDTGVVAPQGDGGLGETYDIFTPEGEMPEVDIGELPGISTPGGGVDRSTAPVTPGGTGTPGGPAPLDPEPPSGPPTGPTHEDLGLDPETFFEYQPSEGVVVITHADGTQETRPWP